MQSTLMAVRWTFWKVSGGKMSKKEFSEINCGDCGNYLGESSHRYATVYCPSCATKRGLPGFGEDSK